MSKTIIADAGALRELLSFIFTWGKFSENNGEEINVYALFNKAFTTEQPEKWVPEKGEQYWYIWSDGEIVEHFYQQTSTDERMFALGNIHPTKEAAEKHLADYRERLKSRE